MTAVARSRSSQRAIQGRRRLLALGAAVALVVVGLLVVKPLLNHAVKEITLPLRHEDIIRQQAQKKHLDPALVAAVIYAESKFVDQTSSAGATGLMQITPETARFIERRSGGTTFVPSDLSNSQINIAYGTYYLRYLLDRYGGDELKALAAYNAGDGNVDRWIADAHARGTKLTASTIPFGETRAYVQKVLATQREYRDNYARELGLG